MSNVCTPDDVSSDVYMWYTNRAIYRLIMARCSTTAYTKTGIITKLLQTIVIFKREFNKSI